MAEEVLEKIEPQKRKRSLGKLLLLMINVLLFLSGAAFFLLTKFGIISTPMIDSASTSSQTQTAVKDNPDASDASATAEAQQLTMRMRPFVINLSGDHGRRLLRVILELEVQGGKARDAINDHETAIRDRLIFLLSSKTFDDIGSIQGKYQLQAEIAYNINDILGAPLVTKTYFTEFVVQ
jgi:flagellar FliL protein